MKLKVAVLQYDVPEESVASFVKLEEMVKTASEMGTKLVVAPETAVGEFHEVKNTGVDYLPKLAWIASKYGVFLATSYYKKTKTGYVNYGLVLSPNGLIVIDHDKIYPAKPEIDKINLESGNKLNVGDSDIGKLGILVCKDGFNKYSHFLYHQLGELGAQIICVPTWSLSWSEINTREYIKSLFTYGSFISRSFVLMSGNLNKSTKSFGKSLIISPIKGVLQEGSSDKEEILVQEIDLNEVKKARDFDSWWQPIENNFPKIFQVSEDVLQ